MSYAETRKGKKTGIWIGERTIKGEKTRFRNESKRLADEWEKFVDRTGEAPVDAAVGHKHSFGNMATRARLERAEWKASRDPSLDQRLGDVVEFFGATTALEKVTTAKMLEFVQALEARGGRYTDKMSGKTINRYLSVVSAILDHARFLKVSTHAPNIPWQKETEGRTLYFKDWQDAPMLAALAERPMQVCYEVFACAALRPTEFFGLKANQIDVRNDWAWLRLHETKNDAARSIPIDVELGRELLALITGGTFPTHDEFYKALKEAVRTCGYDEDLCVYSLRHTGLTRAARNNAGAKVQTFGGHRSYKTTQKYIHMEDEDMAAVAMTMRRSA